MGKTLIQTIFEFLFGKKYYAVVANRTGMVSLGLMENICMTKEEAEQLLKDNMTFSTYEIVSFRSRQTYIKKKDKNTGKSYIFAE